MAPNDGTSSPMQSPAGSDPSQIPATQLREFLPESIGAWRRESYTIPPSSGIRLVRTSIIGTYASGTREARLTITDMGNLSGIAAVANATAASANLASTSGDAGIDKVYKQGSRTIREQFHRDGNRGEVTVMLVNGIVVAAEGTAVDVASLKSLVDGVDLGRVEALQRPGR